MRTPERRLEIVSFRAKPIAKPVSPNPATSADTLTPKVPRAVTIPKIMSVILLVRASSKVIFLSSFSRSALLVISLYIIFARIKKTRKTTKTPPTFGAQRVVCSIRVCTISPIIYQSLVFELTSAFFSMR